MLYAGVDYHREFTNLITMNERGEIITQKKLPGNGEIVDFLKSLDRSMETAGCDLCPAFILSVENKTIFMSVILEATTGFEPVNRGFADPCLNHLATSPHQTKVLRFLTSALLFYFKFRHDARASLPRAYRNPSCHCKKSRPVGTTCLHAGVRYGTQAWQSLYM